MKQEIKEERPNMLVEENMSLVDIILKQIHCPQEWQEDIRQEGYMGLCIASTKYDEKKQVLFRSYAAWWVRKYMFEAIRRYGYIVALPQHMQEAHIYTEKLDAVVGSDDGEPLTYEDVLRADELPPDEQMVLQEGLNEWARLTKQQKMQKKRIDVGKFRQKYVNK